jgi:Immunity protein 51
MLKAVHNAHSHKIRLGMVFVIPHSRKKHIVEINAETNPVQSFKMPENFSEPLPLDAGLTTDSTTFVPFILIDGHCRSLVLFDHHMAFKYPVFAERSRDGWTGNGDDWTSIAQIVVAEQFDQGAESITYDSDADIFSARGNRSILEKLGAELQAIFRNDDAIRDLISRVTLRL